MDIPVVAMLLRAGVFSKIILVLLLFESILAWTIIIQRLSHMGKVTKLNKLFRRAFDQAAGLPEVEKTLGAADKAPLAFVGKAGAAEFRRIVADARSHTGVKDWSFFLETQFAMAAEHLESLASEVAGHFGKGAFLLAIVSSSAPFIGLLGTVWGIMDAFYNIGQQGSASLPVVAPGIAEALIATAIALIVAIPAAMFYNVVMHRSMKLEDELFEFKDLLVARIRREVLSAFFGDQTQKRQA